MEWHLVIKYFKGECDNSEKDEVESWRNTSEENLKTFTNLKKIWAAAEKGPESIDPDFEKAWENIQSKTDIKERFAKRRTVKVPLKQFLKVAAVLLVIVGVGTVAQKIFLDKTPLRTESTASVGKKEVLLPDGTTIYLNRNSQVTFPEKFNGKTREVKLEGEAFFHVAKDREHPFIVHAHGSVIKVLGTSFNIKAKNSSQVLVSVLTGKVAFSPEKDNSQMIHLEKGECGQYDIQTQQLSKSLLTDENFLAWKTGILNFNNSTLGEAVKVLSAYYSKPIEVQPSLKNRVITVSFDNQPLNEALKILEITLDIKIDNNSERVLLEAQANN